MLRPTRIGLSPHMIEERKEGMKYQIEYNVTVPCRSAPIEAEDEDEALAIWREARDMSRTDPSIKVVPADPDWPEFTDREER